MISRSDVRFQRKIYGSCCDDCLQTACCPCCVLVQEEKEELDRLTQPGYQSERQEMVYGQPQQRPAPPEHHMSERMKIALAADATELADTAMNDYN